MKNNKKNITYDDIIKKLYNLEDGLYKGENNLSIKKETKHNFINDFDMFKICIKNNDVDLRILFDDFTNIDELLSYKLLYNFDKLNSILEVEKEDYYLVNGNIKTKKSRINYEGIVQHEYEFFNVNKSSIHKDSSNYKDNTQRYYLTKFGISTYLNENTQIEYDAKVNKIYIYLRNYLHRHLKGFFEEDWIKLEYNEELIKQINEFNKKTSKLGSLLDNTIKNKDLQNLINTIEIEKIDLISKEEIDKLLKHYKAYQIHECNKKIYNNQNLINEIYSFVELLEKNPIQAKINKLVNCVNTSDLEDVTVLDKIRNDIDDIIKTKAKNTFIKKLLPRILINNDRK